MSPSSAPIAVIGAGMAGLACARALVDEGLPVVVFDKGRGIGGRLATRRRDGGLAFDHGAQYATARDPAFRAMLEAAAGHGTAVDWPAAWAMLAEEGVTRTGAAEPRWVGVPGMSGLVRELADGLPVHCGTRIERLTRDDRGTWTLIAADGTAYGPFRRVVLAVPAPQAAELLGDLAGAFPPLAPVRYAPCWAAMAAWEDALALPFDVARLEADPVLGMAARTGTKPGRPEGPDCWVLHATPDWSRSHLETAAPDVAAALLDRFLALTGVAEHVVHLDAHRWRYALVERPAGAPFLHHAALGLGLCGDWCLGPRIELAFLSGHHLAAALLEDLVAVG